MTDLSEKQENMKEFDAETVQERLKTVENHKSCGQNLQNFACDAAPGQSQVIDLPDHHPHPLTFEIPSQISILAEREIREPDLRTGGFLGVPLPNLWI